MFQKQKYKYIIKQLNSRKMNIDLYSELCLLFEIYNDLNTIKTTANRKIYEEVNGVVVKEKLNEIVNRMSA